MTTFVKGALNCGQVRGPVQLSIRPQRRPHHPAGGHHHPRGHHHGGRRREEGHRDGPQVRRALRALPGRGLRFGEPRAQVDGLFRGRPCASVGRCREHVRTRPLGGARQDGGAGARGVQARQPSWATRLPTSCSTPCPRRRRRTSKPARSIGDYEPIVVDEAAIPEGVTGPEAWCSRVRRGRVPRSCPASSTSRSAAVSGRSSTSSRQWADNVLTAEGDLMHRRAHDDAAAGTARRHPCRARVGGALPRAGARGHVRRRGVP